MDGNGQAETFLSILMSYLSIEELVWTYGNLFEFMPNWCIVELNCWIIYSIIQPVTTINQFWTESFSKII